MGQAAARFTLSVIKAMQGEEGIVECAYVQSERHTPFFAQPVRLGRDGIEEILDYGTLSAFEHKALDGMMDTLTGDISKGEEFVG